MSCLLQGTEPKHTQHSFLANGGKQRSRATSNKGTKGKEIDSSVFREQNLSWQQNVPFVIKAALLRQVISRCLSLEQSTMLPCVLWLLVAVDKHHPSATVLFVRHISLASSLLTGYKFLVHTTAPIYLFVLITYQNRLLH